jgi:hypothetical protein
MPRRWRWKSEEFNAKTPSRQGAGKTGNALLVCVFAPLR